MSEYENRATEAALAPKISQKVVASDADGILASIASHADDAPGADGMHRGASQNGKGNSSNPGGGHTRRSHAASQPTQRTPLLPKGTITTREAMRHKGDPKKASVCVSVHQARELAKGAGRFVKVRIGKDEKRTPTSMPDPANGYGVAPEWHQHFWFVDLAAPEDVSVDIQLFEVQMGKSERVGEVTFPLRSFMHGKIVDKWYPVMNFGAESSEASGQLRVRVHYRRPEHVIDDEGFLANITGKRSWLATIFCCGCQGEREH